jgi:hypothetical protein
MSCPKCHKTKCCCKASTPLVRGQKKIIKVENRPGPAGPTGTVNLPVANTAFVSKSGNNSTALVERFDKPFLTIQAAINALVTAYPSRSDSSRVQVIVFDGRYTEDITMKPYVDIHLFNVRIDGAVSDGGVDFGSSADGVWTNVITGQGSIQPSTIGKIAVSTTKPNSKFLLYVKTLSARTLEAINMTNGFIRVHAEKIYTEDAASSNSHAIELLQGFSDTDYSRSVLEVIGADIYNPTDGVQSTIGIQAGGASKNQALILIDCRVSNLSAEASSDANSSCISVGPSIAAKGEIKLYNTVLYSINGKSIYTETGSTATTKCYHSNMSNKDHGGSGTNTFALGSITVNAAVEAEF